jgi:hypothetical protein
LSPRPRTTALVLARACLEATATARHYGAHTKREEASQ